MRKVMRGVTLMELMIVVVILGILTAVRTIRPLMMSYRQPKKRVTGKPSMVPIQTYRIADSGMPRPGKARSAA